jgi:hypothetical protein
LRKWNIDATNYLPNESCRVFKLLKLDDEKYADEYVTKIESGTVNSVTEICVWLLGLEEGANWRLSFMD